MAAGPIERSMKWISDADEWYSREYDDTYLVFFRPSVESHFLNFLSFGALKRLSLEAMTVDQLLQALRDEFLLKESELPLALVETVIEQLDEAGMIRPKVSS